MTITIVEPEITTRVLLVDDHDLVRAGIRALIEQIPALRVVAEARDGGEALLLIAEHEPDLVFLDIRDGFEILYRITKEFPKVRVIILSAHESEDYVVHALRSGAAGYLSKKAAFSELSLAIETVMSGEVFIAPQFSIRTFLEHVRDPTPGLTPRQFEVLRLIAESHTTKHIALTLDISVKTVESHRAQLMERLNIHDVPGLVRYAIRIGLVKIEGDHSLHFAGCR
jgi:DNA-binding NarL/FixJ family response regulator